MYEWYHGKVDELIRWRCVEEAIEDLFQALDLNRDGSISRDELHEAARRLAWGWRLAPILAVLDLLTIPAPMTRDAFMECMGEIMRDPEGPYGRVLVRSPEVGKPVAPSKAYRKDGSPNGARQERQEEHPVSLLRRIANRAAADEYGAMLERLEGLARPIRDGDTALFVIDPQRSFTEGVWKQSIGPNADSEVMPIKRAFQNCAHLLREIKPAYETVFSRCPFPPGNYDWDATIADVLDRNQVYFIKPGNSILWPPTNGFHEWVNGLLDRGKTNLVIGGCTLNSCVRVSAIDVQRGFADRGLLVIVDLSLCGGRASNYVQSPEFGGLSSVEAAVNEMISEKVSVVPRLEWQ